MSKEKKACGGLYRVFGARGNLWAFFASADVKCQKKWQGAAAPVSLVLHQRDGRHWKGLVLRIPKHPGFTRFGPCKGNLWAFFASADVKCQKKRLDSACVCVCVWGGGGGAPEWLLFCNFETAAFFLFDVI